MNSDTTTNNRVFVSSNGHKVRYQAISLVELTMAQQGLEREYRERSEPLDPPTYEVEFAGGEKQTFPHDATTLDKRGDPEKNRAAWLAYQQAQAKLERENASLVQEIVFGDGIIEPLPEDSAWEDRQKRRHILVPQEPEEKRVHWLSTVALPTVADIKNIIADVLAASSAGAVGEAELNAALDSFRHYVPSQLQNGPADLGRNQGEAEKEAVSLDAQHKTKRAKHR